MKRARFVSGMMLVVFLTFFVGAGTVRLFAQGGTWATESPMPTARGAFSTSAVNGVVYAVGGYSDAEGTLATVEAYDAASNSWTPKASMPTARYVLSTSEVNGIIYAIGGRVTAIVEAYDPASDTWTTKTAMPTPRGYLSTCVVNGIIYAIGGYGFHGVTGTVEAYDPASDTWTTKASMPTPRFGLTTSAVNGVIYAIGGTSYANGGSGPALVLGVVEAYDPASDTWTTKASLPTPRYFSGASVVSDAIYVVGGQDATGVLGTVEAYTPASDTWTTKDPMPTARQGLGTSAVNGVIYAVGGYTNNNASNPSGATGFLATNEAFTPTPPYVAQVQPPIRTDGLSVFKANRAVIPVKFTLSIDGTSTCNLPPATISLSEISGANPGPVNSSEYITSADNGSSFRIDSSGCQYVYNLGTTGLGSGQYVVQISISNSPVGSATFRLN